MKLFWVFLSAVLAVSIVVAAVTYWQSVVTNDRLELTPIFYRA